ncbi:MAG: hypothetical protein M3136_14115 [Thermoproteota archaeon]|nr:hypothetical protein [Thermoproteota archaeon]
MTLHISKTIKVFSAEPATIACRTIIVIQPAYTDYSNTTSLLQHQATPLLLRQHSRAIVVAAIAQSHKMIIAVQERLQDNNDVTLLLYMLAILKRSCFTEEL